MGRKRKPLPLEVKRMDRAGRLCTLETALSFVVLSKRPPN